MVAQTKRSKTSSQPEVRAIIACDWKLPNNAEIEEWPSILTNLVHEYTIEGTIGDAPATFSAIVHQEFANLPAAQSAEPDLGPLVSPQSMKKFILRYGSLSATKSTYKEGFERRSSHLVDDLRRVEEESKSASFDWDWGKERGKVLAAADRQDLLRCAWRREASAVEEIQRRAMENVVYGFSDRGLQITTKDVWALVCLLFLRDHAAGKLGVCANPHCPVPYFVKNRRTQKICETGDCVAWAQRKYALRWWRENKAKSVRRKK
jgi:hypothetical protein